MKSKLMLLAACGLLVSCFACGCAAETGTQEGASTDPKAAPAEEKTETTESPLFWGTPGLGYGAGYGLGYGAAYGAGYSAAYGVGYGAAYGAGYGAAYGVGYPGYGVGYPGYGMGYGLGYGGWGGNLNGGFNRVGPY